MNERTITLRISLTGFLLAWCLACHPPPNANIEDVVVDFVPHLHLGMPLDSATQILTDVKTVEYWGHIGKLAEVKNFPRIGVRGSNERAGAERVAEIHMFSPRREIVPGLVQAISSAAHVIPQERCTGRNSNITIYVWQVNGGRILLTDNKAAVPGADAVHLWFVTPDTDRSLTYPMKRCN